MKQTFALIISLALAATLHGQGYTNYFTGNAEDVTTSPKGGVCIMGGASENDRAMRWFLERADGGDILVLRASGSDGYNDYLHTELGVSVNSVETIVFEGSIASTSTYIQNKIKKAEGIWFAGGDQWKYVSYWRGNTIGQLINEAITDRNIVVGGTSAGMAILGEYYFSAKNGTVTTSQALANPYDEKVTPETEAFLDATDMENVITDTHYDNPDRKGRHVAFMARIVTDHGADVKGIACDEYTAVCIDENGKASVFGEYPREDDNAYFIKLNGEPAETLPEKCEEGEPLTWSKDGKALKVYAVKGTTSGSNYLDLTDWETGEGGDWRFWYVNDGAFQEADDPSDNPILGIEDAKEVALYPNPVAASLPFKIYLSDHSNASAKVYLKDLSGRPIEQHLLQDTLEVNTEKLTPGLYLVEIETPNNRYQKLLMLR